MVIALECWNLAFSNTQNSRDKSKNTSSAVIIFNLLVMVMAAIIEQTVSKISRIENC